MNTDKRPIIEAIARELKINEYAILQWRRRGVPYRYHLPILQAAAARGVILAITDLRKEDAA